MSHGVPAPMTERPSRAEISLRLRRATDASVGLTVDDIRSVHSLIDVGELLVAFEILCTQIYEWEIGLEPGTIRDLAGLGVVLGARSDLTDHLWEDSVDA